MTLPIIHPENLLRNWEMSKWNRYSAKVTRLGRMHGRIHPHDFLTFPKKPGLMQFLNITIKTTIMVSSGILELKSAEKVLNSNIFESVFDMNPKKIKHSKKLKKNLRSFEKKTSTMNALSDQGQLRKCMSRALKKVIIRVNLAIVN